MRNEKWDRVTTDISSEGFCCKGRERNGEDELEGEVRARKSLVLLLETVSGVMLWETRALRVPLLVFKKWCSWCLASGASGRPWDSLSGLSMCLVPFHCSNSCVVLFRPSYYSRWNTPPWGCVLWMGFSLCSQDMYLQAPGCDYVWPSHLSFWVSLTQLMVLNNLCCYPRPPSSYVCIILFINTYFRCPLSRLTFRIFYNSHSFNCIKTALCCEKIRIYPWTAREDIPSRAHHPHHLTAVTITWFPHRRIPIPVNTHSLGEFCSLRPAVNMTPVTSGNGCPFPFCASVLFLVFTQIPYFLHSLLSEGGSVNLEMHLPVTWLSTRFANMASRRSFHMTESSHACKWGRRVTVDFAQRNKSVKCRWVCFLPAILSFPTEETLPPYLSFSLGIMQKVSASSSAPIL